MKINIFFKFFILVITVPFVLNCGTIMHGTSQEIGISSQPTGADVIVDNKPLGKTPVIADLKRKNNHLIVIKMEGYKPYEINLVKKLSSWVWGNILTSGIFSVGSGLESWAFHLFLCENAVFCESAIGKQTFAQLQHQGQIFGKNGSTRGRNLQEVSRYFWFSENMGCAL